MLKEALKWVADHTGISWILGKLSSGWKWLFSSKTDATENSAPQQPEKEQPAEPSHTIVNELDNYLEVKDKRLYLNLTKENFEKCKNYHNSNNESAFFNQEYGRNKFRMYIKHDEKEFRIIGTPDGENCRIDIDLIIERNNSVNDNGKEVRFSIHKAGNVQLSHGIGVTAISKKNDGSILNMVETALKGKIAVKVSNEPFVDQTTTPKQQPEVSNDNPVGATQPATPEQPNEEQPAQPSNANEPVVDQTTMPKQPNEEQPAQPNNAAPVVDVIRNIGHFRVEGDDLVLSLTKEEFEKCKGSKYLYIKYDGIEHRVTGRYDNNNYNMHVTSIAKIENGVLYESQNIVKNMKDELKEKEVKTIDVESVSTAYSGKSLHVVQCPPLVEGYIRIDDDKLIFVIKSNSSNRYEGYINPANKAEHLFFIQCGGKEYRITGILDNNSVIINSIVEVKDGIVHKNDVLCPADHMETIKKNLELSSDQLLLVDGTRLSIAFIKIQQNGEPKEERFEVRRTTEEEIAAGRAAREAALNGESDSMTESTASFRTATSTLTNAHLDTEVQGFDSMTESTASFMTAASTLSSPDDVAVEMPKDPYGPAEMQQTTGQQMEAIRNGEGKLHFSPELANFLSVAAMETMKKAALNNGKKLSDKTPNHFVTELETSDKTPNHFVTELETTETVNREKSL